MSLELERLPGRPPSPRRDRIVRIVMGTAVTVGLLLTAYLGVRWLAAEVSDVISGPSESTVPPGQPVTFEVTPGTPASQIARDLAAAGVVSSAAAFDRAVRDAAASDRLQAGTYEFETGMDPDLVLELLVAGPPRDDYLLTVVEGLTAAQMLESINRQTGITLAELTAALLDGSVTSGLLTERADDIRDWEGLLFPDTYEFEGDATATDILGRLAATGVERVGELDWTALAARGLSPYEGLIIASLIEREALLDDDRAIVASVILNRLELGMKLQFDSTVVYALGGLPDGGLSLADLEIDSPYNTYRYSGLPPTPISGVGQASLAAAASAADTDFLYFMTRDDTGKLHFTADFDEFLGWQAEGTPAP